MALQTLVPMSPADLGPTPTQAMVPMMTMTGPTPRGCSLLPRVSLRPMAFAPEVRVTHSTKACGLQSSGLHPPHWHSSLLVCTVMIYVHVLSPLPAASFTMSL